MSALCCFRLIYGAGMVSRSAGTYRLVAPAVGAWGATAGCTLVSPSAAVAIAAGGAGVGAVLVRRCGGAAALMLGLVLGALVAAWHVRGLEAGLVPDLARHRADSDVIARLVRDPIDVTTTTGSALTVIDATVTNVLEGGRWRSADSPILVLSYGSGWDGLLPGQRVEIVGRLTPPRRGDDVAAVLDARAPPVALGRPPWWQRAAGRVRVGLRRATGGLPADERGLVPGLVDGDVSAVPESLRTSMRLTGLTHLMAVSGENVSVVLSVVLTIARSIGLRRRSRIALSSFALLAFVVLARPSPSVLRAAVMGGIVLLGLAAGRRIAAIPALSAAVLVLVCVNPFLARSVGFALSVCATAAILVVAPVWTDRLSRRMPTALAAMIAVPAAAQLACMPLLVLAFGQLTPYAVPSNLVAALAVVPATVLGVTCSVVATASVGLAVPVAWLAAFPAALIALVARGFAALPGAGLRWPGGVAGAGCFGGAAVIATILIRQRRPLSAGRDILVRWSL